MIVDRVTVTVRQVKSEADPPDRVISVELDEVDVIDPKEITDLLHSHDVFTYHISESQGIGNWGASWGAQEIVITVGAMAQIIDLLINVIKGKRGANGLKAEEGVERAENFMRQYFEPRGQLVCDGITRALSGLTVKFHDDTSAYHVDFSDAGMLISAERVDRVQGSADAKPPV